MLTSPQMVHPTYSTQELQHLYGAFNRLVKIGATNSPTIDNLKRIVVHRIAEIESDRLDLL